MLFNCGRDLYATWWFYNPKFAAAYETFPAAAAPALAREPPAA
jgi:hypothetical protein